MAQRAGKSKSRDTTPYDSQWKAAITALSRPFMDLFFPQISAEIDWTRGWEPLDKDLRPDRTDDVVGVREPDLIFRVYRLDGQESWVAIHIEFQSHKQDSATLAERVWVYFTRIRQRYGRKVCSLVLLGDLDPDWELYPFNEELWGCRCQLTFPVAKLLRLEPLLDTDQALCRNPFSWIVRLHLAAKRSTPTDGRRRAFKLHYLRELFCAMKDGRLNEDDWKTVQDIHAFHDGILSLSAESDKLFRDELERDKEVKMIRQQEPRLTMFQRWELEDERERTKEAEKAAKEAEKAAEKAAREARKAIKAGEKATRLAERQAKEERRRAEQAEREVARLRAELEALKSRE